MKSIASLRQSKYGSGYEPFSADNYPIYLLGYFLSTEVGYSIESDSIYEWLKNPNGRLVGERNLIDIKIICIDFGTKKLLRLCQ